MMQTILAAGFGKIRLLVALCCVSVLVLAIPVVQAYTPTPVDDGIQRSADPALGINETFGRWNTSVKLIYDPDGAPAAFSNNTKMVALIQEAAAQWEKVCNIHFEVVGIDSNAPDDSKLPFSQRDGFVRLSWVVSTGFAGRAGPQFASYNQSLGYFPYSDGNIELDKDPKTWKNDQSLVTTMVHELGHLIGLGHSENPVSVMYANPYNFLGCPREDDIRAVQALYGAGSGGINPTTGVSEWRYPIPPAAPTGTTQYLFKPNEATSNGAFLSLQSAQSTSVTAINDAAADGQYLILDTGGLGAFANNKEININSALVVIDPDGYQWRKIDMDLQCDAQFACGGSSIYFITTEVLKSYPGTWKFLLVDETNNALLLTQTLTVLTAPVVNAAPVATISAVQGTTNARVVFTLTATDSEKNNITVIWHPPGQTRTDVLPSGGTAVQTMDFSVAGTYTLFVELKDNSVLYADAGDGFSNLLQLTVNLPLSGINGGVSMLAQHSPLDTSPQGILKTVAAAKSYTSVSTAGTTNAIFTMGASKDSGATTTTTFKSGDSIVVSGALQAQSTDLNKAADIFVVVLVGANTWFYRDSTGQFRPWSQAVPDLKPALTTTSLQSGAVAEIYKGPVAAGTYRTFIGYRSSGSSALHYTSVPMLLTVTN